MKNQQKNTLIEEVRNIAVEIDELSKKAKKTRHSLSSDNYYGRKFDKLRATLSLRVKALESKVQIMGHPDLRKGMDSLKSYIESLSNPQTATKVRSSAKKELIFILDSQMEPFLGESDTPKTPTADFVIPMAIVKDTKKYIENIALQVNGCYEFKWFDACAVMIRRLIETLIIECFEYHKISSKIQDSQGDFFQLKKLIAKCLQETAWNLGRKAKKALPEIKELGDLSAHSRRFWATKADIDKISNGVRIVVQELVDIAGLK